VKVIGIDPSLTATGIARADGTLTVVGGPADLRDHRLALIYNAVHDACMIDDPDLVVLEDLPKHAHSAGITGMVQGVVRLALVQLQVSYATVVASTLKKYATGRGTADKADMRMALYRRAGIDERDDNLVDAWWLRHAGLDQLGEPVLTVPKAQRDVLDVVSWPDLPAVTV
jgi:Holliday junction resolvasome RuvABC endonuclease subunit